MNLRFRGVTLLDSIQRKELIQPQKKSGPTIGRLALLFAALMLLPGSVIAQTGVLYSDIHDFGGPASIYSQGTLVSDGDSPLNVVLDAAGNLYGTSANGGLNGDGLLYKITAAGQFIDLHDFGGTIATSDGTPGDDGEAGGTLIIDSNGNLFGSPGGGKYGRGMIWEYTNSGNYRDLYDFPDTGGIQYYNGTFQTIDSKGNLWGTSGIGGLYHCGGIWKLTAGGAYSQVHDFGGTIRNANGAFGPDGSLPMGKLAIDSSDNLYGCCFNGGGGPDSGLVWKLSNTGVYTDLHDFYVSNITYSNGTTSGIDGENPTQVIVDPHGNLFGTASWGGVYPGWNLVGQAGFIWELDTAGHYRDLHDFGGSTLYSDGTQQPDGMHPQYLEMDGAGNIFGFCLGGGEYNNYFNSGGGNLWEIDSKGNYSNLHEFSGQVDPNGSVQDAFYSNLTVMVAYVIAVQDGGVIYGVGQYGGLYYSNANIQLGSTSGMVFTALAGTQLNAIAVPKTPLTGGARETGTIQLATISPIGGITVDLASNDSRVTVPSSVTVPGGQKSVTFSIVTKDVTAPTSVTLTAKQNKGTRTATVSLVPVTVGQLGLNPAQVVGGANVTGTVTLTGPARSGGTTVNLSSSSSAAKVGAEITIPAGHTSATFPITTVPSSSERTVAITAECAGSKVVSNLVVKALVLTSLKFSPSTLIGGSPTTCTIGLSGVAGPNGADVTLTSSSGAVVVPKVATLKEGEGEIQISLKTTTVSAPITVKITAAWNGVSKTATLGVRPKT